MNTDDPFKTGGGIQELEAALSTTSDPMLGEAVGSYRIESLIAEGGMGRVYRAVRVDGQFDRTVAIKLLPAGMSGEYIRRFEQERQILASLAHPNIAQLYDAGLAESGSLYLVIELIDGMPIDQFARARNLSTKAKTRLMLQLSDALAFAHSKLVVHRDLKPSNVFINTDGDLKLLDFGISKILESPDNVTAESRPMTPRYASPEQLLAEPISVASDVYQFGLLFLSLFEARAGLDEETRASATERAARKTSVTAESRLAEQLPAELDAIINKCLRAEPAERYASAGDLAQDLSNYLGGFPVAARNPGFGIRAAKFVKRNVAAVSVALVAIVAIAASTAYYLVEVSEQRDIAESQYDLATESMEFLFSFFEAANPYATTDGQPLTARDILEQGAERVETELADKPELQQDLLWRISVLYWRLGQLDKAEYFTRKTLEVREQFYTGEEKVRYELGTKNLLAVIFDGKGEYERAEQIYDEIIERGGSALGDEHIIVQEAIENRSWIYYVMGRYDEAVAAVEQLYAYKRQAYGPTDPDTLATIVNLASLQSAAGLNEPAEELLTAKLSVIEEELGEFNYVTVAAMHALAGIYYEQGRYEESLPLLNERLQRMVTMHGADSPEVLAPRMDVAQVHSELGDYERAETELRAVLNDLLAQRGEEHFTTMQAHMNLSLTLIESGRADEGKAMLETLLPRMEAAIGAMNPETLYARSIYAQALVAQGDPSAMQYCTELLPLLVDAVGEQHRYTRQLEELIETL